MSSFIDFLLYDDSIKSYLRVNTAAERKQETVERHVLC